MQFSVKSNCKLKKNNVFDKLFKLRPRRLVRSRTRPFHGRNMGSNPVGATFMLSKAYPVVKNG